MSYTTKTPFHTVRLRFTGDDAFVPLFEKNVIRLSGDAESLRRDFQRLFQKKVVDKGNYDKFLGYHHTESYEQAVLTVHIPQPKHRRYPAFDIEFDYLYHEGKNGCLGIVPAIGTEAYGEDADDLKEKLEESILLDFKKNKRLRSMYLLIPTLWYKAVKLEKTELSLDFLTPAELAQIDDTKKDEWLPKVARLLVIPRRVVYGREEELERMARVLKGRFNRNILLVGASGVGKTALVWELAHRKKELGFKQIIWETTASTLIRELTGDVGWEQNLAILCRELSEKGEALYVRNFLELFEVGQYAGNNVSMAEYIRTYLSRGEVNLITECTPEELAQIDVRSPNYTALFQVVKLEEPREDLENIIVRKVNDIARLEKVVIEPEAIKETIRLNRRFTPYSGFPGKPIRFLESILLNQKNADKREQKIQRKKVQTRIDRSSVIKYFCEETGMPSFMVDPNQSIEIGEVRDFFHKNVFGQDPAVDSVTNMFPVVKTDLSRQGKPIASFLFVGLTGVGKTELAKVLAEFMFGNRKRMVRFDMSEFSNPYDVQRLTGLGYYQDGLLTAAVRREPFCVLLFDEIEKADATFYDLLLQMLGSGRLTDSSGRLVNFCSTIVIMTSNIGAKSLQSDRIGWKQEIDNESVNLHFMSEVQKHFRPELLNRMDEIIPFQPISKDVVKYVVNREIGLLKKREGIAYRDLELNLSEEVLDHFATTGYDPKYGARQIQRTLREGLVLPLSKQLNLYDFEDKLVVNVTLKDDKTHIEIEADPLKTELLLEELSRDRWTEHAGDLRRSIAKMKQGSFYLKLMSDLNILEREKRRIPKTFWTNETNAQNYTDYLQTRESVDIMTEDVRDLEEDFVLVCMGLKHYNESLVKRTEAWEAAFNGLKRELYKRVHKNCDHRKIALIGSSVQMGLDVYFDIFKSQNYDYQVFGLWYRESYYEEIVTTVKTLDNGTSEVVKDMRKDYVRVEMWIDKPLEFEPEELEDVFVGIELRIDGDCAGAYLGGEDGLHKWKVKSGQHSYFVISTSEDELKLGEDLHRKNMFKNAKARRIYEPTSLEDKKYGIKREIQRGNYSNLIKNALDDLLEKKLDEVLA